MLICIFPHAEHLFMCYWPFLYLLSWNTCSKHLPVELSFHSLQKGHLYTILVCPMCCTAHWMTSLSLSVLPFPNRAQRSPPLSSFPDLPNRCVILTRPHSRAPVQYHLPYRIIIQSHISLSLPRQRAPWGYRVFLFQSTQAKSSAYQTEVLRFT